MAKRKRSSSRNRAAADANKAMVAIAQVKVAVMEKIQELYSEGISLPELGAILGGVSTDLIADFQDRLPIQPTREEKEKFLRETV